MKMWRSNEEDKCGLNLVKFMSVFLVIPLLLWLAIVLTNPPSHGISALLQVRNFYFNFEKAAILEENDGVPHEKSCVSRYELPLYRRGEARKPSPHLISKLGSYEARHRRCGPHTDSFNKTLVYLQSNTYMYNSKDLDCKYVVWLPCEGLGNQMLSLASAFLCALLTDRVLLAHRGKDFSDLFCEPFPEASLFLPSNFPLAKHFDTFNQYSNHSYANLLSNTNLTRQPYVYLNLIHDYPLEDQLFFCDQDQTNNLQHIPWLILKSDLYFVPSLFLMPMFQQELHHLFPEKDTVFHLLARYLFHPRNSVWGLVTRYYQAYLSKADVRVGIQVRVFDSTGPFTDDQILSCINTENILPPINYSTTTTTRSSSSRISVVMASLRSSYMERIKEVYLENPTETGEWVSVFQPSHEEYQQTEKLSHDRKALAEMYLLSLTDKLVTSGWSTFGYVGAALGGVKPWILQIPQNETMPNPACGRAMSMEPCFHYISSLLPMQNEKNNGSCWRCATCYPL